MLSKESYYPIFLIYVYYVLSLLFLFVGGVNNSGPVHMWLDVYNDGTIVCYGPANGRSLQVVCWAFLPWGPPFASTSLPPPMTPPPIITYLNKTIISPFKCTMSTASRTPPPYPPQAITKPVSQARATTESQGLYTQITWTLYYTDFSIIFRRNPCTILQRKEWLHWHLLTAIARISSETWPQEATTLTQKLILTIRFWEAYFSTKLIVNPCYIRYNLIWILGVVVNDILL